MSYEKLLEEQPIALRIIKNSYNKDRLAHSYLFEGNKGTSKFKVALYFAKLLLCNEFDAPCGVCDNCQRIDRLVHPNIYIISPENGMIKKGQIKELQSELSKKSLENGPKFYIIKNIECLNSSSANSLLKILEEPVPNQYALLLSENKNKILPTIISRCQIINFNSLSKKDMINKLVSKDFSRKIATVFSMFSNDIIYVEELINNELSITMYNDVRKFVGILANSHRSGAIYYKDNCSYILKDRDSAKLFITLIILFQKDIIKYKSGLEKDLVYFTELDNIVTISKKKSTSRLNEEMESMLQILNSIDYYINMDLNMLNLIILLERE